MMKRSGAIFFNYQLRKKHEYLKDTIPELLRSLIAPFIMKLFQDELQSWVKMLRKHVLCFF
jgi:hypothetical protein